MHSFFVSRPMIFLAPGVTILDEHSRLKTTIAPLLLGNRRSSWSLVVDIMLTTLLLLPFVLHKEDDLDDDNPLMMCILDIIGAGAKP